MKANGRILLAVCLLAPVLQAQKQPRSKLFKTMSAYMPTLSEVGFLVGVVNTYMQAASLVRVINAEVKMAKRAVRRFDELEQQSKRMWHSLKSLQEINVYDMDSWAVWLDRAENLVDWEASTFTRILFDGILTDFDKRLSVDFVREVGRARSYSIGEDDALRVLSFYYHELDYRKRRAQLREDRAQKLGVDIALLQNRILQLDHEIKRLETENPASGEISKLKEEKEVLFGQMQSLSAERFAAFAPTALDRQVDLMTEMNEQVFYEIPRFQERLASYQKELKQLYGEWETLTSGKVPKSKNLSLKNEKEILEGRFLNNGRDKYDDPGDNNSDIAQTPKPDDDFPDKAEGSTTQSAASLADVQHLKNRIEFLKLLIAQTSFNMELFLGNAKSIYLAHLAYNQIEEINSGTSIQTSGGRLAHRMREAVQ